jgi:hypothetical protein
VCVSDVYMLPAERGTRDMTCPRQKIPLCAPVRNLRSCPTSKDVCNVCVCVYVYTHTRTTLRICPTSMDVCNVRVFVWMCVSVVDVSHVCVCVCARVCVCVCVKYT